MKKIGILIIGLLVQNITAIPAGPYQDTCSLCSVMSKNGKEKLICDCKTTEYLTDNRTSLILMPNSNATIKNCNGILTYGPC